MGEFSITHIVLVLVILLFLFGPSKLPGLGKSMGEAIRGFKKGLSEGADGTTPVVKPVDQQLSARSVEDTAQTVSQKEKDKV